MSKRRIYCISGLGADEQIFSKLQINNTELVVLQWLIPFQQESFADYARRMFEQVKDPHPVMMGISFGGMTCVEIAKQFPLQKLFLVSSIKSNREMPIWMKTAGKLQLHRFVQPRPHRILYPIENYFLGATGLEEQKLANSFRGKVDPVYLQWSIHQILSWKNVTIPPNLIHIHGTGDRIFPGKRVKADHLIKGGGHFMLYNRAAEISALINHELIQLEEQAVK